MGFSRYVNSLRNNIMSRDYRFLFLSKYGLLNHMNDRTYLERMFHINLGVELDLDNPKTFNEKLQWLKLYDRNPLYTTMVDKYEAKKYVESVIGQEYVIPTLGIWNKVEDIDFGSLPTQFVIKCTHDSHGIVICKNKEDLDIKKTKKLLIHRLKKNYYYRFREWPYKNVKPRIIAEKYMEDTSTSELRDYKFFCFNGMVKCFKVDFDRFIDHKANYYTPKGTLMKLGESAYPPDLEKKIELPIHLKLMKELAEKLSKGIPFVRVDFYEVDGRVYFGELTFFPSSGFGRFTYEGNDDMLGSWLVLPKEIKK